VDGMSLTQYAESRGMVLTDPDGLQATPGTPGAVWRGLPGPGQLMGGSAACALCAASIPQNATPGTRWTAPGTVGPIPTGRWWPPYSITYTPDCRIPPRLSRPDGGEPIEALVPILHKDGTLTWVWITCQRVI
jgi:hypothetical protein